MKAHKQNNLPTPEALAKTPKLVETQTIPLVVDENVAIYFKREAKRLYKTAQQWHFNFPLRRTCNLEHLQKICSHWGRR